MSTTIKLPKNDSAVLKYRVRLPDKSFLNFTDYAITLTVRSALDAAGTLYTNTGGIEPNGDDTVAVVNIPANAISAVGCFPAAIRALNTATQKSYTYAFTLQTGDHA